jgi:hypothetical protein
VMAVAKVSANINVVPHFRGADSNGLTLIEAVPGTSGTLCRRIENVSASHAPPMYDSEQKIMAQRRSI